MSVKCSFTVRGRGPFPVDMLRYDQCWPVFPDDADKIRDSLMNPSYKDTREIQLNSTKSFSTDARWSSFGWYIDMQTVEYFYG